MGINEISKRDFYQFNKREEEAGKRLWAKSNLAGRGEENHHGRVLSNSLDAEATAPKTWIMWKNAHKGEPEAIIECEIYTQPRASDSREMVGCLHGMCPKCGETFIVREDNKSMTLDWMPYIKAKGHLKEQWERHCREVLKRMPRSEDKIAVVGSPERWLCDYCKGWCVKVTDSIAITDMSGATQLYVQGSLEKREDGTVEPTVTTKESEIIL